MKGADEKRCATCDAWATNAEGDGSVRRDGDGGVAEEAKRVRTMYRAKCEHVKAKQKSRSGIAKWRESVCTVRCSNKTCLSLFDEQTDMSEAQNEGKWGKAASDMRLKGRQGNVACKCRGSEPKEKSRSGSEDVDVLHSWLWESLRAR